MIFPKKKNDTKPETPVEKVLELEAYKYGTNMQATEEVDDSIIDINTADVVMEVHETSPQVGTECLRGPQFEQLTIKTPCPINSITGNILGEWIKQAELIDGNYYNQPMTSEIRLYADGLQVKTEQGEWQSCQELPQQGELFVWAVSDVPMLAREFIKEIHGNLSIQEVELSNESITSRVVYENCDDEGWNEQRVIMDDMENGGEDKTQFQEMTRMPLEIAPPSPLGDS